MAAPHDPAFSIAALGATGPSTATGPRVGWLDNTMATVPSTLAIAANASTLTIGGAGFDGVTPANNTVTLDDGATGTVTAATATSLTVSFGTKPVAAGPLSAVVVNGGIEIGQVIFAAGVFALPMR